MFYLCSKEQQSASFSRHWAESSQGPGWTRSVLGTVTQSATWFHLALPSCCTQSTASSAVVNKAFQTEHCYSRRQSESQSSSKFFSEAFTVFPLSSSLADCDLFITAQLFLNLEQTENWCVIARMCLWNGWVGKEKKYLKHRKVTNVEKIVFVYVTLLTFLTLFLSYLLTS